MLIRAEQMTVFEQAAETNFEQRLAAHLLENYGSAVVRLPDMESAVSELHEETLLSLVKNSIESARRYGLTFESSISAFSAIRFEVSPNFDKHRLSQVLLKDETLEPNARFDELLEVMTEKNWETVRGRYDVNAWQAESDEEENTEVAEKIERAENPDFAETVMNVENTKKLKNPDVPSVPDFDLTVINADNEASKSPAEVKKFDLDETMMDFGNQKKSETPGGDEDIDFLDTVMNIDEEGK